jgi:hypothetical protein
MRTTIMVVGAGFAAVLAGACDISFLAVGDDVELRIRSDRASYLVERTETGYRVDLTFTLRNEGDVTVYVANCAEVIVGRLEKQMGDEWITTVTPNAPLCLSVPTPIRPGRTLGNMVHVFAAYAANEVQPKLQVPGIEGTYRVVFESLSTSPDDPPRGRQTELPQSQRTSNSFRLE